MFAICEIFERISKPPVLWIKGLRILENHFLKYRNEEDTNDKPKNGIAIELFLILTYNAFTELLE